jgi:hypothetical protein
MTDTIKKEIEALIHGRHFDDESYKYSLEMGRFLLGFTRYLETRNMSERTRSKHEDNLFYIGSFECNYGCRTDKPFNYKNFAGGASYEYEFERKVSDSPTALASYRATWNYLDKYITSKTYLNFKIE